MRAEVDLTNHAGKFIVRDEWPGVDRPGRSCRVCETCGAAATHTEIEQLPHTSITRNGTVFHQSVPRHRYYCNLHTAATA